MGIDPDHILDTFLFLLVGGGFWTVASTHEAPILLLLGLPFMVMFLVSVWRVIR